MTDSAKAAALRVAQATFEGLAPLLVQHGVTSPEAEALLRAICVHAAAKTQEKSRRPNVSRVSIKTGVDRHSVAALLRKPPDADSGCTARRDVISRVLEGWCTDPDYNERGSPRDLEIGDPTSRGRTVWSLIQRYAPGVWPRLIVEELIRLDYVYALPNGQLRWKRLAVSRPLKSPNPETARQLMRDAVHTLFMEATQQKSRPAWRTAQSLEIDEQELPLVRKMLRDRLNTMFGWIIDELSSDRWRHENSRSNRRVRIGLSGFAFEEFLIGSRFNEKPKAARRARS